MGEGGSLTRSSTKTLPFFLPLGFCTPTGVMVFSFGMSNSFSVYTRFFLFFMSAERTGRPLIWVAGLGPLGFLDLRTPSDCGLLADLLPLMPELLAACLFFTVRVRETPILSVCCLGFLSPPFCRV